jgi:hypothetical protein
VWQGHRAQRPITFGGEDFSITCVSLDLGYFDCILGIDYLRTLETILWDFEAMMLAFWLAGRHVLWKGVSGSASTSPPQHAVVAAIVSQQPLLDRLLQQHDAIFEEPQGLPPAQPYDYRIHLLPDAIPIAVRPYHYPQLQKDELEW